MPNIVSKFFQNFLRPTRNLFGPVNLFLRFLVDFVPVPGGKKVVLIVFSTETKGEF